MRNSAVKASHVVSQSTEKPVLGETKEPIEAVRLFYFLSDLVDSKANSKELPSHAPLEKSNKEFASFLRNESQIRQPRK